MPCVKRTPGAWPITCVCFVDHLRCFVSNKSVPHSMMQPSHCHTPLQAAGTILCCCRHCSTAATVAVAVAAAAAAAAAGAGVGAAGLAA